VKDCRVILIAAQSELRSARFYVDSLRLLEPVNEAEAPLPLIHSGFYLS